MPEETKKKTKTIGVNMPIEEAHSIEKSAKSIGLSTGMYIKMIVRDFRNSGAKLVLRED